MANTQVYLVTNRMSGERYVGVTAAGVALRWQQHCWKASHAAAGTGVHFSNISRVCLEKRRNAGGMTFSYVKGA